MKGLYESLFSAAKQDSSSIKNTINDIYIKQLADNIEDSIFTKIFKNEKGKPIPFTPDNAYIEGDILHITPPTGTLYFHISPIISLLPHQAQSMVKHVYIHDNKYDRPGAFQFRALTVNDPGNYIRSIDNEWGSYIGMNSPAPQKCHDIEITTHNPNNNARNIIQFNTDYEAGSRKIKNVTLNCDTLVIGTCFADICDNVGGNVGAFNMNVDNGVNDKLFEYTLRAIFGSKNDLCEDIISLLLTQGNHNVSELWDKINNSNLSSSVVKKSLGIGSIKSKYIKISIRYSELAFNIDLSKPKLIIYQNRIK